MAWEWEFCRKIRARGNKQVVLSLTTLWEDFLTPGVITPAGFRQDKGDVKKVWMWPHPCENIPLWERADGE